jgi:hypothetical protein
VVLAGDGGIEGTENSFSTCSSDAMMHQFRRCRGCHRPESVACSVGSLRLRSVPAALSPLDLPVTEATRVWIPLRHSAPDRRTLAGDRHEFPGRRRPDLRAPACPSANTALRGGRDIQQHHDAFDHGFLRADRHADCDQRLGEILGGFEVRLPGGVVNRGAVQGGKRVSPADAIAVAGSAPGPGPSRRRGTTLPWAESSGSTASSGS